LRILAREKEETCFPPLGAIEISGLVVRGGGGLSRGVFASVGATTGAFSFFFSVR